VSLGKSTHAPFAHTAYYKYVAVIVGAFIAIQFCTLYHELGFSSGTDFMSSLICVHGRCEVVPSEAVQPIFCGPHHIYNPNTI
jgi:hypothetical protein